MIILLTKGSAYSISKKFTLTQFDHKTRINVRNQAYQFPQQLDLLFPFCFLPLIKGGSSIAQENFQNG